MTMANPNHDPMVKIELEAAEALAGLAHFPAKSGSLVKDEFNDANSSFDSVRRNFYEDTTNSMVKKTDKLVISTAKSVKDEHNTQLKLNPTFPTNCASSGRKSRQNLTEAEIEARKIRRILANRESARQTIHRRQAIFEELTRKAVDLAWENEKLKREKDSASKHYDSLKTKNERLKAQMTKITNLEAEEESTISATSSTNSPFIIYNQPPFLPFVWPNSVQLQCGPPAGIVFPSHVPINKSESSSCEETNSVGTGGPVYLLPYPWLVTLPQTTNEHQHQARSHSFNLNDKPKDECQQFFPEKTKEEEAPSNDTHKGFFPPDGGGGERNPLHVSCVQLHDHDTKCLLKKHDDDIKGSCGVGDSPNFWSGKRVAVDTVAAAEARKRRKQLTRLKNNNSFHCRQLRIVH